LADDHGDFLREVAELLANEFEIVGTVQDGLAVLEMAAATRPDVVVLDVRMPKLSGLEAGRRLIQKDLCSVVVVLTMYNEPLLAKAATDAGMRGYVLKVRAAEDLIPAIYAAIQGGVFVSPGVA
jgi:DNA-binding NarL/FixJ family response regulator